MNKNMKLIVATLGLCSVLVGCSDKTENIDNQSHIQEQTQVLNMEGKVQQVSPELKVSHMESGEVFTVDTSLDISSLELGDVISFPYTLSTNRIQMDEFVEVGVSPDYIRGFLVMCEPYIREDGWTFLAVDLNDVSILSQGEKDLFFTRLSQQVGSTVEVMAGSKDQLIHSGHMESSEYGTEFHEGMLLTVGNTLETESGFTFSLNIFHTDAFTLSYEGTATYIPETRFFTVEY